MAEDAVLDEVAIWFFPTVTTTILGRIQMRHCFFRASAAALVGLSANAYSAPPPVAVEVINRTPIPVTATISNTPNVSVTSLPAERAPASAVFAQGDGALYTVPAQKDLLIEFVSIHADVGGGGYAYIEAANFFPCANCTTAFRHTLPLNMNAPSSQSGLVGWFSASAAISTHLWAHAGDIIVCRPAFSNGHSNSVCAFSGRLVDAPAP